MRRNAAFLTTLLVSLFSIALAQENTPPAAAPDEPIVQILRQCVSSMRPVDAKTKALIEKQKQQLGHAGGIVRASSAKGAEPNLDEFFATGDELRRAFADSSKKNMSVAEYSPDPSYCANHCEQTCGYNSVGEKVCWYTCYRCCSNGGC